MDINSIVGMVLSASVVVGIVFIATYSCNHYQDGRASIARECIANGGTWITNGDLCIAKGKTFDRGNN